MRLSPSLEVVWAHAEGEVGLVVTGGAPEIPGHSVADKFAHISAGDDRLLRLAVFEPRGTPQTSVNILLPPTMPEADAGFVILQPDGVHAMSGSNAMCVVTVLLETGILPTAGPRTPVGLETAAGLVRAVASCADGRCERVALEFVPSFAADLDLPLEVEGLGSLRVDIAFGGCWFVLVDAAALGLEIAPAEARHLVSLGSRIRTAARERIAVGHPLHEGFDRIEYVLFHRRRGSSIRTGNVMYPGRLDRSPCGTGTAAVLAALPRARRGRARGLDRDTLHHRQRVQRPHRAAGAGRAACGDRPRDFRPGLDLRQGHAGDRSLRSLRRGPHRAGHLERRVLRPMSDRDPACGRPSPAGWNRDIAPPAFAVDARTLGLYVHWPFCRSKCPYCDFNSHVETAIDQRRWRDALLAEVRHFAALTPGRRLQTVFFGGGTPSLMPPETVAAVIETAASCWETASDIEITLEANPTSVEAARLSSYRAAGVGRLSLGVQSLEAQGLRALGREHGVDEAIEAVAAARSLFGRISFDLIYARPGQTREGWRRELARALGIAGTHLSVYQLTIERGTVFHGLHRRGELVLPPDDVQAGLFEDTRAMLAEAGLPAYEISNHARPGDECRHNLIYWLSADYVGVGPGAHGRITGNGRTTAFAQRRSPESWRASVESAGHATEAETVLEPSERVEEIAMMGLRLTDGVPRERFAALTGMQPEALFDPAALERLTAGGFLEVDARGLRATQEGRLRLDAVLGALLAGTAPRPPTALPRPAAGR